LREAEDGREHVPGLRDAFQRQRDGRPADRSGLVDLAALLLWGEQDALVPRATQETLLAGHWDDPRRFAAEVTRLTRLAFS
jgi:hypothetical protein